MKNDRSLKDEANAELIRDVMNISLLTSDCPFPSAFACVNPQWTAEEAAHIAACPRCQSRSRAAEKVFANVRHFVPPNPSSQSEPYVFPTSTPHTPTGHGSDSCPALSRFMQENNSWTADEISHIQACEHCLQKIRVTVANGYTAKTVLEAESTSAFYFLEALAAASTIVEGNDDRQILIRGFSCTVAKWLDREVYGIRIVGPVALCGVRVKLFANSLDGPSREEIFSRESSECAAFEVEFPRSESGDIIQIISTVVQ